MISLRHLLLYGFMEDTAEVRMRVEYRSEVMAWRYVGDTLGFILVLDLFAVSEGRDELSAFREMPARPALGVVGGGHGCVFGASCAGCGRGKDSIFFLNSLMCLSWL